MFVRAYLRASTDDQNASRAKSSLKSFAASYGKQIAAYYTENESGTLLDRPELNHLISDAHDGDILLIESVDRLTRLDKDTWDRLRTRIHDAGIQVVSIDLPLTYAHMKPPADTDSTHLWMTKALSSMFIEFMAAFARKDYETRQARQRQGIQKAQAEGRYKGRSPNLELHGKILDCLNQGFSIRKTAKILNCSVSTIVRLNQKQSNQKPQ